MLHYHWLGTSLTMFTLMGLMLVFPRCPKRLTKTADLKEKVSAEHQVVHSVGNVRQIISKKKAGAAKPYSASKEANLPVD